MTRVIAGVAGGRRLRVPAGRTTRPTADRVREAVFSTVESLRGPFGGLRVADLWAGSGALGLEALSRGAAHALLVEADPRVARVLRGNVTGLGLPGAEVRAERVQRVVAERPPAAYDVVFADPPYADPVDDVLEALVGHGWLAEEAVVVLERATRGAPPSWPVGVEALRSRRYGETTVWYGRRS